jgi:spermidine synthase
VNLYTKEFFELCKTRLNDKGILCLWIPISPIGEMRMVMKTFCSVFPNTQVWQAPRAVIMGFYMIGFRDPDSVAATFRRARDEPAILADLNEWKFEPRVASLDSLRDLLIMNPRQLAEFVEGEPVITDDRPYTEFPLWRIVFSRFFAEK